MDEVYSKINDEKWEIPPSCRYVSDSDSPLSLLPSPPSVPSSPVVSAANVMMSMMMPSSAYNQSSFNSFTKIPSLEDDDGEEAEYRSVMFHEHIIATNDSIACVRPQSVSIKWPNNVAVPTDTEEQTQDENDLSANDDRVSPTTSICDSIKIIITRNKTINLDKEQKESEESQPIILIEPQQEEDRVTTNYKKRKQSPTINGGQKKKRTVTSYDSQTSFYLKSVFFEVYSKQLKLTKDQRMKVQEKTGLPSRNITYWFSNHKRRFQSSLKIYRKAVRESNGAVKSYDDFIQWRKKHDLPDQVMEEEVLDYEEE